MRRFMQFSIRTLLILMLAVACYFGGWQSAMWKAERDKREANARTRAWTQPAYIHDLGRPAIPPKFTSVLGPGAAIW